MTALTGLRVIEIGTLIAAPFAARLMAEFGAEVIKIEALDKGDPLRKWRKLHEGTSLWWYLQSRNKKSLALNLRSAEGVALVKQLVEGADVLIENLRPRALEKLGLGVLPLQAFELIGRPLGLIAAALDDDWSQRSLALVVRDVESLSPVSRLLYDHLLDV